VQLTRHARREYPSILACISGSRADVLILHVAAAFARAQQIATGAKPQFSGVSFQEVSDRPSSYFFTVHHSSPSPIPISIPVSVSIFSSHTRFYRPKSL
jgi:hypothetical protein